MLGPIVGTLDLTKLTGHVALTSNLTHSVQSSIVASGMQDVLTQLAQMVDVSVAIAVHIVLILMKKDIGAVARSRILLTNVVAMCLRNYQNSNDSVY